MKIFITCMALAISGICQAEVPKLLTERVFTPATLAEAVNHYVALGEEATFKELKAFIAEDATHTNYLFNRGYSVDERIGWIFRILYEPRMGASMIVPKTGVVIPGRLITMRAPMFGILGLPEKSMPAEIWPLYPLALSGSTYIVLKERYTPKGVPETAEHYMAYCRNNGDFRKAPVPVPTREQALKDTQDFRQSAAWKSVKWFNEKSISFPLGEEWTWAAIQHRSNAITNTPAYVRRSASNPVSISLR
jgi:hypothetical protein